MIRKKINLLFLQFTITSILFTACSKDDVPDIELPELKTIEVTDLMYNRVTVNSIISSNGGDSIVEQGVCWSLQPTPTISDFLEKNNTAPTTDFSVVLKDLQSNIKYYVRSYAINGKGLAYGEELSFTLWLNKPEETVTDIDNNSYSTVRIGDQIWMKENLKVTHYRNGDAITQIPLKNDSLWLHSKSGAYCSYQDDNAMADIYGNLYNGYAVTDERSICPEGWHIPTKEEWQTLVNYCGGRNTAGNLLKSSTLWSETHSNNNNLSGFTAIPAGMRWHSLPIRTYTEYWGIEKQAYFATSDFYENNLYENIDYMWYANMNLSEEARVSDNTIKTCGQSVRCIKD